MVTGWLHFLAIGLYRLCWVVCWLWACLDFCVGSICFVCGVVISFAKGWTLWLDLLAGFLFSAVFELLGCLYRFRFCCYISACVPTCLFICSFTVSHLHRFQLTLEIFDTRLTCIWFTLWNLFHFWVLFSVIFLRWSSFLNLVFLFGLSFTWTSRNVHRNRILLEVPKFSLSFPPEFRARSLTATLILFSGSKFGF